MACTANVSTHGARLVVVRGVKSVGEILALDRGKKRALYRVMWIGKPGTPQQNQIGVQCIEPGKMMWDEMLEGLEEQYEPVLAAIGAQITHDTVEIPPGRAQVQVFNEASGQALANGELIGVSYNVCDVKTKDKAPPRASVQILITSAELDVRLRGPRCAAMPVQKYDIRRPETEGGGFEERYWSPVNLRRSKMSGATQCAFFPGRSWT